MESIKLSSTDGGEITLVSVEETAQISLEGGLTGPEGATGPAGPDGAPGVGVPVGGSNRQVLLKQGEVVYDTIWGDLTKNDVGLASVDNTPDVDKPISNLTQTALDSKEPTLSAGTSGQYYRGDKTWQSVAGLPVSTATQTALDAKANNSSVVHLTGDESIAGTKSFINQAIATAGMTISIDPVELTDATNKQYVDESIISGFKARGRYDVRLGVVVDGELYRAVGDGTTDDAPALQVIMQYITDNGGGEMWFPIGTYMCRSSVWIRDSVLVNGLPFQSILTSDVDPADQEDDDVPANERMYGIFRSDQVTPIPNGWGCENVMFKGNVTEHPTVPQANRTRDPSPFHAIKINGSKAPDTSDDFGQPTSGPLISNIFIRNITVKDMASLPITIWGVSDRNITTQCFFDNNKDIGYVYNDEVIFTSNHSSNSSDNGVSLSRGNRKVVCVGNTFENAALFGIWLSGYNSDIGPTQFVCTGNTIKNSGRSGIYLDYGPSYGVVSNNYIEQGYHRGPWDALSDTGIDGVTIAGASGGVHATVLSITNNIIVSPARNGITVKELDDSLIANNLIVNPGTAFKADLTTPILSTDTTSNNGICPIAIGSYSNVRILDNYMVENRDTPLGNWPISNVNTGGTYARGNRFTINSWRNKNNTVDIIDAVMSGNDVVHQLDGVDANVSEIHNMKGAGKFMVRNSDGSGINNVNTSTSSSASATYLFTAGNSNTNYIGAITTKRKDASGCSIMTFRILRNGILADDDTDGPLWVKGLPANTQGVIGLKGGLVLQRKVVADANYTALAIDHIIGFTTLTAGRTLTLKDATTLDDTQTYKIMDESGSAGTHNITIAPAVGTINGVSSIKININNGWAIVYSDGTNWHAYGSYKATATAAAGAAIPADYGFLAQNMALSTIGSTGQLTTAGTVYVVKLRTDIDITVANIHAFITGAGSGLTSGQNFAALYDASKNLLAATADQSTSWNSTGMKTMALTSAQSVSAGYFYVAFVSNGTTRPTLRAGQSGTAAINGVLSLANSMFATADTGITTTMPATLGTFAAHTTSLWAGVS